MVKTIGRTFGNELVAAGLANKVGSFVVGGTDEDIYAPNLSVEEQATLDSVIAAHDADASARSYACKKKKDDVEAKYADVCNTCAHSGYTWQADRASSGAIVATHYFFVASPPANVTWHDILNNPISLSWADFVSLKDRIYNFHEDAYTRKQWHKNSLDDMVGSSTPSTVTEIENYDITTGWPA